MAPKLYLKKKFVIPIYGAKLWIVVSDNVKHERDKMDGVLGNSLMSDEYEGLCSCNYSFFGIFFDKRALEHRAVNLIAHETFHLTHRIIEWTGANFNEDNHEHGAILHGYLLDLVYREVSKFGKVCS